MGADGASVGAGVIAGAPAGGVIRRVGPPADLTVGLPHVLLQVHGHQHLAQPAVQGVATAEATHPEAQVRVQAPQHDSGKPLPIAPGSHQAIRQIEAQQRRGAQHAVNNGK